MPTINKKDVQGGLVEVGWHRARVKECRAKISQGGDSYYNLAFEDPESEQFLSYDVAMLEGRGNGIGIAKLVALGACRDNGEEWNYDLPEQIEGMECYIFIAREPYIDRKTGETKAGSKVDISQGRCGYLPLEQPPVGMGYEPVTPRSGGNEAVPMEQDDDIPF